MRDILAKNAENIVRLVEAHGGEVPLDPLAELYASEVGPRAEFHLGLGFGIAEQWLEFKDGQVRSLRLGAQERPKPWRAIF